MRERLYDGRYNLREVGNERRQELDSGLYDFRQVREQGIYGRLDDLRQYLAYRRDNVREVCYEGRQEGNARLDDLRHGLEERRNEALYQRGESLKQYRDSLDNARREPCHEL